MSDHFTKHQINFMKVALAMVIIRQKPKQENVRTFTEKLQFEFNQKQLNWKQQAELLAQELMKMKQENCIQSLVQGGNNVIKNDEITLPHDDIAILNIEMVSHNHPLKFTEELTLHIKFIHNVYDILRQTSYLQHDHRHGTQHSTFVIVKDSIIRALKMLQECLANACLYCLPIEEDTLRKFIQSLLGFLKMNSIMILPSSSQSNDRKEVIEVLILLIYSLIDILCRNNCNPTDASLYQFCIYQLSSVEELYKCTVISLVKSVEKFVKELKNFNEDPFVLGPDRINGLGSILRILDNILTNYDHQIPDEAMNHLDKAVQDTVSTSLQLPLIGFSVWKLHGQLKLKTH